MHWSWMKDKNKLWFYIPFCLKVSCFQNPGDRHFNKGTLQLKYAAHLPWGMMVACLPTASILLNKLQYDLPEEKIFIQIKERSLICERGLNGTLLEKEKRRKKTLLANYILLAIQPRTILQPR